MRTKNRSKNTKIYYLYYLFIYIILVRERSRHATDPSEQIKTGNGFQLKKRSSVSNFGLGPGLKTGHGSVSVSVLVFETETDEKTDFFRIQTMCVLFWIQFESSRLKFANLRLDSTQEFKGSTIVSKWKYCYVMR